VSEFEMVHSIKNKKTKNNEKVWGLRRICKNCGKKFVFTSKFQKICHPCLDKVNKANGERSSKYKRLGTRVYKPNNKA